MLKELIELIGINLGDVTGIVKNKKSLEKQVGIERIRELETAARIAKIYDQASRGLDKFPLNQECDRYNRPYILTPEVDFGCSGKKVQIRLRELVNATPKRSGVRIELANDLNNDGMLFDILPNEIVDCEGRHLSSYENRLEIGKVGALVGKINEKFGK
jgi:hypothetical protein